ncbi:MAG: 1-acyl-sn-glycerol-3-phosphate acyltransferase [Alphaproteobacteria bacterium]|nr:MAG: 1-acyl-sn-glycerol-3-phosphate acyltransferase [Alphaproteobacteria bacterium]
MLLILTPLLLFPMRYISFVPALCADIFHIICKYVMGLDYKILGQENIANKPCIYAIKHESAWDTMIFPRIISFPAIVTKRELIFFPILGLYIRRFKAILINRKKKHNIIGSFIAQANERLHEGRPVIIFPEGTRVNHGDSPALQSGVWLLYARLKYPVIPVTLDSGRYWGRRAIIKKPGCISVIFQDPIQPGMTKESFLATLHSAINAQNSPLTARKKYE